MERKPPVYIEKYLSLFIYVELILHELLHPTPQERTQLPLIKTLADILQASAVLDEVRVRAHI